MNSDFIVFLLLHAIQRNILSWKQFLLYKETEEISDKE